MIPSVFSLSNKKCKYLWRDYRWVQELSDNNSYDLLIEFEASNKQLIITRSSDEDWFWDDITIIDHEKSLTYHLFKSSHVCYTDSGNINYDNTDEMIRFYKFCIELLNNCFLKLEENLSQALHVVPFPNFPFFTLNIKVWYSNTRKNESYQYYIIQDCNSNETTLYKSNMNYDELKESEADFASCERALPAQITNDGFRIGNDTFKIRKVEIVK